MWPPLRFDRWPGSKRTHVDLRLSADYIHIITPRHGPTAPQLPLPEAHYGLVSSYDREFDDQMERFLVFHNPSPAPQGLRNRLWHAGVRVITVKPGFVDTEMTFGTPGLFLVADPAPVGAAIVRAIDGRRDVIYVPGFWRYIMWIIRAIPEPVFKRMRL